VPHPERRPGGVIVHVGLTHEVLGVAICIGKPSPGHSNQVAVQEGPVHLQNNHVLVDSRLRPEGRFEHRLVLDLPIKVVYRFIDRVAQVVLREHRVPTEIEGAA